MGMRVTMPSKKKKNGKKAADKHTAADSGEKWELGAIESGRKLVSSLAVHCCCVLDFSSTTDLTNEVNDVSPVRRAAVPCLLHEARWTAGDR